MACGCGKPSVEVRAMIGKMFADGKAAMAFDYRLRRCLSATDCRRICEHLVKGPGKANVQCIGAQDKGPVSLYPALENAEFACPAGRF